MAITTTVQLLKKPLQFLAETTEGTTPGAGTATVCPPVKSISIKKDGNYVDVAQVGPEDLAKLVQGEQSFESSVTFYASSTSTDEAFFQRAIQAANFGTPAGTISETFSMWFTFYLNGTTENIVIFKGTRSKNVSIKGAVGKPHEITIDFVHTNITKPVAGSTPAGVTSVTTFNAGTIHDWLSGGVSPVAVIGSTLDCVEFNCTINRNTSADYVLGTVTPFSSQSHGRRISGDLKNLYTVVTQEGNYDTPTTGTITFVLSTGVSTLTVSTSSIITVSRDYGADDTEATVEQLGYKGLSCTYA